MADNEDDSDKPFDPTPQRLMRAMEEGQVGFSSELQGALVFFAGVLFLWFAGPWLFDILKRAVQVRLLAFDDVIRSDSLLQQLGLETLWPALGFMGAMLAAITVGPVLLGLLQTRFNITTKPLAMKMERLNPVEGFKRIFSKNSLIRTLTSLARASIVALVAWMLLKSRWGQISRSGTGTMEQAFGLACELVLALSLAVATLMVLVGVVDMIWQKFRSFNELRMTFDDFRKDMREQTGDPMIKARMRKIAADRLKSSLVQSVSRATVIVTNPTHFAVAIRYDRNEAMAPVVVAKGADHIAHRIIELAKENGIPVLERKPVARFLYFRAKVGQMIPMEMYMAVAEILNYVARKRAA